MMSREKKSLCLVDAYGTGMELARVLKSNGFYIIHVQSNEKIPAPYVKSFDYQVFDQAFCTGKDDANTIIAALKQQPVEAVIAGSESGIPLADDLGSRLGLAGNFPETSSLRRNKYLMGEAIRRAGLAAVRQAHVETKEDAIRMAQHWKVWPLVIKPLESGGSEGVRFCFKENELNNAFDCIDQRENVFGFFNEGALIQEYLAGKQYVVNTMSIDGKHRITEMWMEFRKEIKGSGSNIYDKEILVPFQGEVQDQLIAYSKNVLDALGVREGATHIEIMMTARGPVLIELGARLQGGIVSSAMIEAMGDSHVTMAFMRYAYPEKFLANINAPYTIKKNVMVVNLIAQKEGILLENNCHRLLSTLPSFHLIVRTPGIGDYVPKTIDLLTKPGHIYLLHENLQQLEADYQQIRQWESENKLLVLSARECDMSLA